MIQPMLVISRISDRDLKAIVEKIEDQAAFMSDVTVTQIAAAYAQTTGKYDIRPVMTMILREVSLRWVKSFDEAPLREIC